MCLVTLFFSCLRKPSIMGKVESFRCCWERIHSLDPGGFTWMRIFCKIALECLSVDLTDFMSTLIQVKVVCPQPTSHYPNQYWPSSPTPYGDPTPQGIDALRPRQHDQHFADDIGSSDCLRWLSAGCQTITRNNADLESIKYQVTHFYQTVIAIQEHFENAVCKWRQWCSGFVKLNISNSCHLGPFLLTCINSNPGMDK